MNVTVDPKRVALLVGLTLFPVAAFAAASASGLDGGLCARVCGWLFGACSGCPGA